MNVQLPAHLSATINSLGDAAKELAAEVRADREVTAAKIAAEAAARRREVRRTNVLLAAIGVLVLLVAGLSVYSRIASNQSRAVIKTIESCTNTDGECAKKGREQTAAAIARLIAMQVEIEACGRDHTTSDKQYRKCVNDALAMMATAPPPTGILPPTPSPSPAPTPRVPLPS